MLYSFTALQLWRCCEARLPSVRNLDEPHDQHLTVATFADAVADGITVVDFGAGWCGPCRAMAPQFERAAALRPNYRFAKVDVDTEPALAARHGIRSIPTLLVIRDGEPIAAHAGVISAERLVDALDRLATTTASAAADREAA
jgi:thioredoxin